MRRRVCGLCHTKFLPKRSDAEFCSNRCRQASYRKKQIRLEADRAFKTQLQIAQNAHDAAWLFEKYRDCAASMSESAERYHREPGCPLHPLAFQTPKPSSNHLVG
jgi:hypothetical protein